MKALYNLYVEMDNGRISLIKFTNKAKAIQSAKEELECDLSVIKVSLVDLKNGTPTKVFNR